MTVRQHPLDWVAPMLVGASAAIAAEVAMGLLIYAGDGFVRSLTTVLAVEVVALGVGLWSAPAPQPGLVDRLRRRWILCILTFMAATIFGVAWSLVPAIGTGPAGQAFGLTVLAAVPLFACGTVLGGMGSVVRSAPHGAMREPGAAAALGAGLGFVLTGLLLPRAPVPASLIVACLVLLSGAGVVYGTVLQGQDPEVGDVGDEAKDDGTEDSGVEHAVHPDGLAPVTGESGAP
jgi:hypothetical protein